MNSDEISDDLIIALEKCREGKVSENLKRLYKMPQRDMVAWDLFPCWARPNDKTEGCHEG